MPHNKALQLTVNPLRGLSAAELRHVSLYHVTAYGDQDVSQYARKV